MQALIMLIEVYYRSQIVFSLVFYLPVLYTDAGFIAVSGGLQTSIFAVFVYRACRYCLY